MEPGHAHRLVFSFLWQELCFRNMMQPCWGWPRCGYGGAVEQDSACLLCSRKQVVFLFFAGRRLWVKMLTGKPRKGSQALGGCNCGDGGVLPSASGSSTSALPAYPTRVGTCRDINTPSSGKHLVRPGAQFEAHRHCSWRSGCCRLSRFPG